MAEENSVVPGSQDGGLEGFMTAGRVWTSLNVKDPAEARRFLKAKAAPDFTFDDVQGQTLDLADAIIHECTVMDQVTGEVIQARRTVLIFGDGASAGFVSEGIIAGLRDLFTIYGPLPWRPARGIVITRHKTSRARQIYLINLPG